MTDIVATLTPPCQLIPLTGWPPLDVPEEPTPATPEQAMAQEAAAFVQTAPAVTADPLAKLTTQDISDLAWDLVLFNDMDKRKILASYAVDEESIARLQQLPLFMSETGNARKALQADPHIGMRRMAKAFLHHRIKTINDMATSDMVEPAVRLKAIDMLKQIAGLDKGTEDKKQGGVAVQINLGSALGSSLAGQPQEIQAFVKEI